MKTFKLLNAKSIHKYRLHHTQQNAGFSLVEVVAVTLMIGILAAIALPSWFNFMNRQRVSKANDVVFAALQEAQQKAKQKKLSYSVSFRINNSIPQIAVHEGTTPTNWRDLVEDLGAKSEQIQLTTNLSNVNTLNSNNSVPSAQTITFDYMGILSPKVNGDPPDTGLKVVVARPGLTKRCVIVQTILGSMQKLTEKDSQCN